MRFADVEGLRTWLESTEEGYGEYAARLWASGGNNVRQLANGSVEDLMDAGITNRLHAIDIKLVAADAAAAATLHQQEQRMERLVEQHRQLLEQQQQLEEKLEKSGVLQDVFLQVLDYSEEVISTAPSRVGFKQQLVDTYSEQRTGAAGDAILCMVTNQYLPERFVIGTHLWKRAWHKLMWVLDLAGQIDDVRNGLLLFKPIAWAFNTSRICFEWDTEEQRYAPHLLDARLKETTLIDKLLELNAEALPTNEEMQLLRQHLKVPGTDKDMTFGDLPAYPLALAPCAPQPFPRVLNFHARRASIKAQQMGWPHESVKFMTGPADSARSKVLAWFEDMAATGADEAQPHSIDELHKALQHIMMLD